MGPNKSSLQHKYRQLLVSLGGHDKADSVSRQPLSLWIIDVVLLNMKETCNVAGFHTSSAAAPYLLDVAIMIKINSPRNFPARL